MSTSARTSVPYAERSRDIATGWPLFTILAIGLIVRLLFIGGAGFHNDISAFEAWALTLTEHPLNQFYSSTQFADYPPGYFFVLLPLGWIYKGLVAAHLIAPSAYGVLAKLVKLPAIAMDIVDAGLLFLIVRRYASSATALLAAALMAFNPAAIYISGYWGQVDSVSWGLVLLAMYLLLTASGDVRRGVLRVALAWVVLAASILVKPQGTFVGLVFIAFAFVASEPGERLRRLRGTALGMAGGLVLAWLASAAFHGTFNPVDDAKWLFARYAYASSVYAYTTINAFNLYALKNAFWQPDSEPLRIFGFAAGPTVVWGAVLTLGATLLIVARYVQRKDDRGFLEAAMLVSFAFFTLATRMHERYSFGAFLLMMPLVAFGRRYLWATIVLSFTLLVNLAYSLYYQTVMEQKIAGVDPTNLWPWVSHPLAALNVLLFFVLGYLYLGGTVGSAEDFLGTRAESATAGAKAAWLRVRAWFDPAEGVATLGRRDWAIAIGLTLASFVLCILWYQWPAEKYFDEIYYPRAGEEYLAHKEIFEYTHPPLTKLIVTLSMMLFGGLHGLGDTGFGWRFLNVVIGALMVGVLYLFAKQLTRSTLFATIAGGMLLFDGFHYVQSRIATPEITVAFFSLTTLYAFYRFWIASQVRRVPATAPGYRTAFIAIVGIGIVLAAVIAYVATSLGTPTSGLDYRPITYVIAFAYVFAIVWVFARSVLPRFMPGVGATVSYAEGTKLRVAGTEFKGETLDGLGISSTAKGSKGEVACIADDEATRSYRRDGTLTYTTPAGAATYAPEGALTVGDVRLDGNDARVWMVVLAISGGALAASKWNGLFDFFVVWGLSALVVAQRWIRRPAIYGNPFGISIDVMIAGMFAVGGAIYTACYIPYFTLGHNLIDMVSLQHAMYQYHSTLVATHPYASKWWQWPILQKPISYWYKDYRIGAATQDPTACCVSEILALPNPFVWWAGLISVPAVAVLAWIHRNKGYALLVTAYFLQWLPWILSPRIAFEYHFFPNLAMIVLCNAIVLQHIWNWRTGGERVSVPRVGIVIYLGVVVVAFFFFYPVLAGVHMPWNAWQQRMWESNWII